MRHEKIIFIWGAGLVVLGLAYFLLFAAPRSGAGSGEFIVPLNMKDRSEIIQKFHEKGFIRSELGFGIAFALRGGRVIEPGGYRIPDSMNAWQAAGILKNEPIMKWVTIPEGLRKEETAGIIGDVLGWDGAAEERWLRAIAAMKPEYSEGVYFPDTYLIPVDEESAKIAERLQKRFEEVFAPFAKEALNQNMKWTTTLTFASLVQREAASAADMPVIAGILWNRLDKDMRLEVDATVQYVRGETEKGWWTPIKPEDKDMNSPYNTYRNKGLPPRPIANPGLDAIRAVLHPAKTECLFYIHDENRKIYCAKTFEEHRANIEKYLKK